MYLANAFLLLLIQNCLFHGIQNASRRKMGKKKKRVGEVLIEYTRYRGHAVGFKEAAVLALL